MNIENVKRVKNSKSFTPLDIVFAVALSVIAAVSAYFIFRAPAVSVVVSVNGKSSVYDLHSDADIRLDRLTVRIKAGKVWVEDADCPDKTCMLTGKISRAGQKIVCLPYAVTVEISGESDLAWEVG